MKTENKNSSQSRASHSGNGRNRHFSTDCEEAHDCRVMQIIQRQQNADV